MPLTRIASLAPARARAQVKKVNGTGPREGRAGGMVGNADAIREHESLSNNRGNNRRRGRGGNRSQNNQFPNRIDSRARGNAAQLLDKHKKLANDAQMNGDRVQAEYHLQFADHYFRVIADNKARQDEQRSKRDDDRDSKPQNQRDDNRDAKQQNQQQRDDSDDDEDGQDNRPKRTRRPRKNEGEEASQGREATEGKDSGEEENPFTRKRQSKVAAKAPAKPRAPRKTSAKAKSSDNDTNGLDPSALPPSIGDDAGEDAPKPRRRTRRAAGDDAAEAVG